MDGGGGGARGRVKERMEGRGRGGISVIGCRGEDVRRREVASNPQVAMLKHFSICVVVVLGPEVEALIRPDKQWPQQLRHSLGVFHCDKFLCTSPPQHRQQQCSPFHPPQSQHAAANKPSPPTGSHRYI